MRNGGSTTCAGLFDSNLGGVREGMKMKILKLKLIIVKFVLRHPAPSHIHSSYT